MSSDPASWAPYGRALEDEFEGRAYRFLKIIQDDGEDWWYRPSFFFRGPEEWSQVERMALDLCAGRILDVGAGAGRHAVELKECGFDVQAIDVCPEAVEVLHGRGIDARLGDVFAQEVPGPFDTLLLMMNGFGLVGRLEGIPAFFIRAGELLAEGGQILLDSTDLRLTEPSRPSNLNRLRRRLVEGRYWGEARQEVVYVGEWGEPLEWLYVDATTLALYARRHGFRCEVLHRLEDGNFLARLTRAEGGAEESPQPLDEKTTAHGVDVILEFLGAYGVEPGDALRRRLTACCRDIELLKHWLTEICREETVRFLREGRLPEEATDRPDDLRQAQVEDPIVQTRWR